jgi:flagellar protein FliO/FliZ
MADTPASTSEPAASAVALAPSALDASPWATLGTTVLSLLLVLALAWLLLHWLRRTQSRSSLRDGPRVLSSVGLGARERLVVVQHHDTEYLLGVTPASVSVIDRRRLDAPPGDAPAA